MFLSATQSEVQRNPPDCSPKIARNPRQFVRFLWQTGTEKVLRLALHLDSLPVFSDRQVSSPVSSIPVGEWNTTKKRSIHECDLTSRAVVTSGLLVIREEPAGQNRFRYADLN